MKKFLTVFLSALSAVIFSLTSASCKQSTTDSPAAGGSENTPSAGSTESYTLTLVSDNGEADKIISKEYGEPLDKIENPTPRNGYVFIGWVPAYETMPACNVTLTAQWAEWSSVLDLSPDGTTINGVNAIVSDSSLKTLDLPSEINGKTITSVGEASFYGCLFLSHIIIPDSVTSIGAYAFYGCSSLSEIAIPQSVDSIGTLAFGKCPSLSEITVSAENQKYHSENNCLIETKTKTLIVGCKNSVIPADGSVTSIGAYAFYGCSSLFGIIIPDTVNTIGGFAFSECIALSELSLPSSLIFIRAFAFDTCLSLSEVIIPESVILIESYAFAQCTALESVILQNTNGWNASSENQTAEFLSDPLAVAWWLKRGQSLSRSN